MKKILFTFLTFLFLLPLISSATCYGPAYDKNAGDFSKMELCVCDSSAMGEYPDCRCPAQKELNDHKCVSPTVGGSEASACEVVGGDWINGTCKCNSGYGWTGSSCYKCGVDVPDEGTFCGSGCAGYGGCSSGTTGTSGTSNTSGTGGIESAPTVTSTGTLTNPIKSGSFADLLKAILKWVRNIALVLAPLAIVYGGFIYMTAAGDTGKVTQGKNIVLYAVIGFIVLLLAESLIGIFKDLVVK